MHHTDRFHAGLDPRSRFQPPRHYIYKAGEDADDDALPSPLLTDTLGEDIPGRQVRFALRYTDTAILVNAEVEDNNPVIAPEREVSSPKFWEQDHIEFRLLPDASRDLDQVQVILAASGKVMIARSGEQAVPLTANSFCNDDGWGLDAELPFDKLGLAPPKAGDTLKGVIAHVRWGNNYAEICTAAPTQLGFNHAERFLSFVFEETRPAVCLKQIRLAPGVLATRANTADVCLQNTTDQVIEGALQIRREPGPDVDGHTRTIPCALQPGATTVPADLELERSLFTRFAIAFRHPDGRSVDLGAISLRAGIPEEHGVDTDKLEHPYVFFDREGLEALRQKAEKPVFKPVVADMYPTEKDFDTSDIPESPEDVDLRLTRRCAGWSRVANESMLKHGASGNRPHLNYIWNHLSEEGQEAARKVAKTAGRDEEAVDVLIDAFNAVLEKRDFYNPDVFSEQRIPEDTREALESRRDQLSNRELFKHNRVVLQSSIECIAEFKTNLVSRGVTLAQKWLLSGDDRVLEPATRCLAAADACMILDTKIGLKTSGLCGSLGFTYDTVASRLSEEQRQVWLRIMHRFLKLYLNSARERHWDITALPNAGPVSNGNGGILAMALLNEFPAEAAEALWFARKYVWNWLDYCSGTDGGNTEGVQYWQYGTSNFLRLGVAIERLLGHDDGLLSHPAIRNTMNNVVVSLSNDGATHGFNDTIPLPVGSIIAWFCAGRFDDDFALWYGDHVQRKFLERRAQDKPTPYMGTGFFALLFRPDVPEQFEQPPVPTWFALHDIEYGIMRSGTNYDCKLVAGVKGSRPPYTHHNQLDTGSYFIHLDGERLLIDPGYYKGQPKDHSLPIIDGVAPAQPTAYVGKLSGWERDDIRYQACEATAAYRGAAERVVRHVLMVGEEAVVLLDDLKPAKPHAQVLTQYQCGGVTTALGAGRHILITGQKTELAFQLLNAPDLTLELHEERDLHDTHWGYHFADCRMFPVTGTYIPDPNTPLITVFLPGNGRQKAELQQENNRELSVVLPSGRAFTFLQTVCGWMLDA